MKTINIDMGGTSIKAGLVENGQLDFVRALPSYSDGDFKSTISRIEALVKEILSSSGSDLADIEGLGIAVPGIVDVKNNIVLDINEKHNGAREFDFNTWAKSEFGFPLIMENDARAALLGEWKYGSGIGYDHIVMITLGTGVGGAAMINGELLYGKHYQAGCLGGHFTVNYNGKECTCGNTGCVEAEASSWALQNLVFEQAELKEINRNNENEIDFKYLFGLIEKGNTAAQTIINHCLKVWSAGIVSMIHAYDPEIVIISGGIMNSSHIILPFIRDWVSNNAWMPGESVIIERAKSIDNSALLGLSYQKEQKTIVS